MKYMASVCKFYFFKCKSYKKTGGSIMKYQTLLALILGIYLAIPYANAGHHLGSVEAAGDQATNAANSVLESRENGNESSNTNPESGGVNPEAEVRAALNRWQACLRRCQNEYNMTNEQCNRAGGMCHGDKEKHTALTNYKKEMDAAEKAAANQGGDSKNAGARQQLNNQKDKNDLLTIMAFGTTAFLGHKTAQCFSTCKINCAGCFALAGVTAMAGSQAGKMRGKGWDLGKTSGQIGSGENSNNGKADCQKTKRTEIIQKNFEGCNLTEKTLDYCVNEFCNPTNPPEAGQTPIVTAGDTGDSGTPGPMNPYQPRADDSTTSLPPDFSTDAFIANLGKKFEPKEGWPAETGGNPFKKAAEDGFSYEKLSDEQKAEINKAMKGFNQRKKAFMAKHGLLNDKKSKDKLAKKEDIPQESFDVAADFSEIIEEASDPNGDTGNSRGRGRSSKSKKPPNTADKIQAMLMQMSRKPTSKKAPRSVVLKNEKVGVREDNIFLMVHRMNRRLDEEDKYFINDF